MDPVALFILVFSLWIDEPMTAVVIEGECRGRAEISVREALQVAQAASAAAHHRHRQSLGRMPARRAATMRPPLSLRRRSQT